MATVGIVLDIQEYVKMLGLFQHWFYAHSFRFLTGCLKLRCFVGWPLPVFRETLITVQGFIDVNVAKK